MIIFSFLQLNAQSWNLVWSDEFDGSTINSSNWQFDVGGGGWGNSELEYYTNRPENATVQNGNLLIIARKESYGGMNYTSARLKTQGLQSWTYGKVEASIKLPSGQGLWPAFWMLGNSISQVGWPACGEIDIMERIDNQATIEGTMHWDDNGHVQYGKNITFNPSGYHIYSIKWDDQSIKWFLDGTQYVEGNITNDTNSTSEFHAPFFILLNMAVGGTWPGSPDGTTPFPDTMFVDYVRVYQQTVTGIQSANNTSQAISVYPNPTNANSVLCYSLTSNANVKLSLYNAFGQEVLPITNEGQGVGNYSYPLNYSGFPSGIYFIEGWINNRQVLYKIVKN